MLYPGCHFSGLNFVLTCPFWSLMFYIPVTAGRHQRSRPRSFEHSLTSLETDYSDGSMEHG